MPPVAGWIDHCVPKANQDALRKLLGKADVWLLSWVGSDSRDRQVKKDIGQKGHGQEMGTATCREKVGPGGKCHFAWDAGCIAVFDDNMQICKESTEMGMEIYPIRTPSQRQAWKRESLQGQRQRQKRLKGLLALKDKEEEPEGEREEDTLEEALKKARKARDSVAKTQNDLEEALEKAKDKLSRQGNATATGLGTELGKVLTQLKAVLEGKKKKPQ